VIGQAQLGLGVEQSTGIVLIEVNGRYLARPTQKRIEPEASGRRRHQTSIVVAA
jgi:hypothetical protein